MTTAVEVETEAENTGMATNVVKFNINDQRIAEVAEEYKGVDAYKDIKRAKEAKKKFVEMRSSLATAHKKAKADALEFGRKCDAEKNRLLVLIGEHEDPITEQLNEIKNAAKRKEEERLAKIQAALDNISELTTDHQDLTSAQLEARLTALDLTDVNSEIFEERLADANALVTEVRVKLNSSLTRAKEREAEEQRLKEQAEELARERAKLEAEKKEAREKEEKRLEEERKRQAAEDERLRKERAAEEARQREARAKEEERERELEAEREKLRIASEKAAAEEKARKEAEAKAEAERLAEERRIALAPDYEKIQMFAAELEAIEPPEVKSKEANGVVSDFRANLKTLVAHLRRDSEDLK